VKRSPMTAKGAERLRAEVERLKSQDRPRVIQAIAEARAHGDLKENAEYHAAREQQGFIEGRIKELEAALSYAEVIDVSRLNAGTRIVFGATVELADEDSGEEITYQIVGDLEADIKQKLISVSSPFARSLIGKSEGDSFEFTASNGTKRSEIVAVRYVG
jgi:transcription elongation factor GreA